MRTKIISYHDIIKIWLTREFWARIHFLRSSLLCNSAQALMINRWRLTRWPLNCSRSFSGRSLYGLLTCSQRLLVIPLSKFIWIAKLSSTIEAFAWTLVHGKLNTKNCGQLRRYLKPAQPNLFLCRLVDLILIFSWLLWVCLVSVCKRKCVCLNVKGFLTQAKSWFL